MNQTVTTTTIEQFRDVAEKFTKSLVPNDEKAVVIGLFGELGAGKTTFMKTVVSTLCGTDEVTSPTFTIAQFYRSGLSGGFTEIIHIDAYRLEKKEELETLGFSGWLQQPQALVCVEWPNQISLTRDIFDYIITFKHGDNNEERSIIIETIK